MIKRITPPPETPAPRLSYGVVVYDDGRRKHRRFFDQWERLKEGVRVRLVGGEWIEVMDKFVQRYPEEKEESKNAVSKL